jgi:hypothetical protein
VSHARPAITLLIGAALAASAACSATSTTDGNHEAAPNYTAADVLHNTIAYAEQLAARTPQVTAEQPFTGTPPSNLAKPDETIGVGDLVVRSRYWTAPGTADHVYREIKNSTPADLRVTGHGLPSLRAEDVPGRGFLNFQDLNPPTFIAGGELYVEMESLRGGTTIIAAFGEAFAHPVREAAEQIVAAGATATAQWPEIRTSRANLLGTVVARRTETLTADQTDALSDAFNGSPVADATGECSGGLRLANSELTVTIRSAGKTWRLVYPGSCGSLSVVRDGKTLPSLDPDAAFLQLLEVLAHNDGTVTGHLLLVGGISGTTPSPAQGEITATSGGTIAAQIHTGPGGRFTLNVQPGRYSLSATSRNYWINGKPGRCLGNRVVTVRTNKTTSADVYCQRR